MAQVVIENPIINSPFHEPGRHFRFSDEGIIDEIVAERRGSSYFMPIPASKKQSVIDTEWTKDRVEENVTINRIRFQVARWRSGGRGGGTQTTRPAARHTGQTRRARTACSYVR